MKYRAFVFTAMLSGAAHAQDMAAPSYLGVALGADEDGGSNAYIDLDLALPADARLLLSVGESRSTGDGADTTTSSWLIGVGSDPLAPFSAGVEFEHWGDEDELVSDTVRLVLGFNSEHWSFSVRPHQRTYTLYTDLAMARSQFEVDSTGVAVSAAYYSDGPWSVNLGYAQHDYERDVSALDRYPRMAHIVFSPTTLDLANSFQDYQISLGASYAQAWGSLSYDWLKSVSEVDGAATTVNTVSLFTPLADQWRLRLHAGWQVDDDTDASLVFGGVGLTYRW